jgi:hypothetical protein
MGRRSKAHQSRLKNLNKNVTAHVNDLSDDNDEDYVPPLDHETNFNAEALLFLDEDDLESDLELEDEEEDLVMEEMEREAAILRFSAVLTEAQIVAAKAERELMEGKSKRKPYMKNSAHNKRYHAQKRRRLAETGQPFIHQFFARTSTDEKSQPSRASPEQKR